MSMSKLKRPATWRAEAPVRVNPDSAIRGRISGPIPFSTTEDDDEFLSRTPSTAFATLKGYEGLEKPLYHGTTPSPHPSSIRNDISATDFVEPARPAPPIPTSVRQSSEMPASQPARPRESSQQSMGSCPSRASTGRPQRKKSTMRSVLGKLFGKKQKNYSCTSSHHPADRVRAGQHRSVSLPRTILNI